MTHARKRVRRFGNVANVEERFYEASRVAWLDHLWRDVRYAVRGLRRSPSFVLTTTLTLAVAIGLLTTAFAVVNGFLRPYAIRDPGGLYQVVLARARVGQPALPVVGLRRIPPAHRSLRRARRRRRAHGVVERPAGPRRRRVARLLRRARTRHAPWPRPGADRRRRERRRAERSGVAADLRPRPRDPRSRHRAQRPRCTGLSACSARSSAASAISRRTCSSRGPPASPRVTARRTRRHPERSSSPRLAAGVTVPQAEGALAGFMRARFDREQDVAAVVEPHPGPNELTLQVIAILTPVFVPFVLVLVTACANVSNVMLARAIRRQREIAVRLSHWREPRACRDAAPDRRGVSSRRSPAPPASRSRPGDCASCPSCW